MYPAFQVRIPELDYASVISGLAGGADRWFGVTVQFIIGSFLFPLIYRALYKVLPGHIPVKGLVFAAALWIGTMVTMMPLMGYGLFAMNHPIPMVVQLANALAQVTYGMLLAGIAGKQNAR